MTVHLCVGTSGMSVWFSRDLGETWDRPYTESGLYLEARVWALSTHVARPGEVIAGTDFGLHRWNDIDQQWTHIPSPMDGMCIWSLARPSNSPATIVAGTHPAGLFRSDNDGKSWRKLSVKFAESCIYIGKPRVTDVMFDPRSDDIIWCGVEIDGVYRSEDGGETWERLVEGLNSWDIHGLAVGINGSERIFVTTNKGLNISENEGRTWNQQSLLSPWQYTRTIRVMADNKTLYLSNGNGPPGSTGKLLRSTDNGKTWEDAVLPGKLNSTPWCIASHPSDPSLLFVGTNLGQLYRSQDGGYSWVQLERELGEIRSISWQTQ